MSANLTAKQEAFCQAIQEGKTQEDAYHTAYSNNTTIKQRYEEASKLMTNPKIAQRLAELKERAMKRHDVTVDSLTVEYEEARTIGKKEGQASSMVSATTGKAKLHGLLIDKQDPVRHEGEIIHKIEVVYVEPE